MLGIAALAAFMTAQLIAPSSASAGTCRTPGCGGSVSNGTGGTIAVTNCWKTGGFAYGEKHPCMTNGWNLYADNAGVRLGPYDTSDGYYYYYDVDGFRVYSGCTVSGYWQGGSVFSYYRSPSQSPMWVRIAGLGRANITRIAC